MEERKSINFIDDPRDIAESWNACGPKSRGNVRVTVLHVEDHDTVAGMAKEMLESVLSATPVGRVARKAGADVFYKSLKM